MQRKNSKKKKKEERSGEWRKSEGKFQESDKDNRLNEGEKKKKGIEGNLRETKEYMIKTGQVKDL